MDRPRGEELDQTESGPPTALLRTVLRGIGISGGGYVITQVLTLGVYLVLARLATPSDFGELAAGTVLVTVGIVLTESGMLAALVHRRDRLDEAAATAVIATFVAGVGFALLALIASPAVGAFFDSGTIGAVAAASAGLLLLHTIPIVPTALLQRRFSFVRRTVVQPLGVVAFGATAVITTANGMGVWGLLLGYYAQALIDVTLSWGLAGWRPRLSLASYSMWRELVGYGRHVLAASIVIRATMQLPVPLLGRFAGAAALGQYRYADRIAQTPLLVTLSAAQYVLFPAFARIAGDQERFRSSFIRSLRWVAAIAIPGGLILVPLGKPLATLVFGPEWTQAGEAAMALSVSAVAGSLGSLMLEVFKADGRPELLPRTHMVEGVVGATAMVILLIPWELIGVAAGLSLGTAAGLAYAVWKVRSVLGIPLAAIIRETGPPLVAGLVMVAILVPVEFLIVDAAGHGTGVGLLLLAAEAAAGLGVYAAVLHLSGGGHLGEFLGLVRTTIGPEGEDDAAEAQTAAEGAPISEPLP